MNGRERFLTALSNQKPDRLPCQVHSWLPYYLERHLNGMDQYEAYEYFEMDPVIYIDPIAKYDDKDLANWQIEWRDLGENHDGSQKWESTIVTPEGNLFQKGGNNTYTGWINEHLIKNADDFEIWNKYYPRPVSFDWSNVIEAKKRIGNDGIIRGAFYDFGQGSPWQSFQSCLMGTEEAIMACYDDPDWVHYVMKTLLNRKLDAMELSGNQEHDLIECGGGGGSSTVISPDLHREFCLPYDKKQIEAFHSMGTKVTYHLCGGLMPMLEIVAENGADALETMTPAAMGGDCRLDEATKRVGDKLAFIGGFDQNAGFEKGNPEVIRKMVSELHAACPDGGYICCPSDHFFEGSIENIKEFVKACSECKY